MKLPNSSVALALSALMASALPPSLSISAAKAAAFSRALAYVNATAIFSRISFRTIAAPIPREPPVTRATRIGDELVSIVSFDEIAKRWLFWTEVSIFHKKISDQTAKTFNAVAAIARKTSGLAPAFAVTFMPTIVD